MAKITFKDPINAAIEHKPIPQEGRGYIGLSQVGHDCDRYLYYVHRNAARDPVYPRTIRIWERGDWEEARIIEDLENIGCNVRDEQKEISLLGGTIRGHIDGIVNNVPSATETDHLLEIKTMNDASWKQFQKKGIKEVNFQYWIQAQVYAHYLKLKRILFVAVNKNTEERCFERIHVKAGIADKYYDRVCSIIALETPPKRIGGPDWYQCKMCSFKNTCHDTT
jgi:hypothetical protein